jgi:hypothetical protein
MPTYENPSHRFNVERTHEAFAAVEFMWQRVMVEHAIHQLPMHYYLVDLHTDGSDRTYAIGRKDDGTYATWLVCPLSHDQAPWPGRNPYVCLENGHYDFPTLQMAANAVAQRGTPRA